MRNLKRKYLFGKTTVDGNNELDYLDTRLHNFNPEQTTIFKVPAFMVGRPDIISFAVYEKPNYYWLIMWANDIVDPFEDIKAGDDLIIPSLLDYYDFFNDNARRQR